MPTRLSLNLISSCSYMWQFLSNNLMARKNGPSTYLIKNNIIEGHQHFINGELLFQKYKTIEKYGK